MRLDATTDRWKGLTIDRTKVVGEVGGARLITHTALLPLLPEGISVIVAGSESDEQEVMAVLASLLATADGQSSRDDRQARTTWVCTAELIGLALWGVVRYRLRNTHSGEPPVPLASEGG